MKNLDKILHLYDMLRSTRQVGSTTALIKGAENQANTIVLVRDQMTVQNLKRQYPNIDFRSYLNAHLEGTRAPIVIDKDVLELIIIDMGEDLDKAWRRVYDLEQKIQKIRELL